MRAPGGTDAPQFLRPAQAAVKVSPDPENISLLLERETISGADLTAIVGAPLAVKMGE